MAKHGKKKAPAKKAHVTTGTRNCHLKRSGSGLSLVCPGIKPIRMGVGFVGRYAYATKKEARKAEAAPPAQEVVVTASGEAYPEIIMDAPARSAILSSEYVRGPRRRK